jgi:hypothetical protein
MKYWPGVKMSLLANLQPHGTRDAFGQRISWCGCPMELTGFGNYPYDCGNKRKHHARGCVWDCDS